GSSSLDRSGVWGLKSPARGRRPAEGFRTREKISSGQAEVDLLVPCYRIRDLQLRIVALQWRRQSERPRSVGRWLLRGREGSSRDLLQRAIQVTSGKETLKPQKPGATRARSRDLGSPLSKGE